MLVTGASGFKGGWLTIWLRQLGAKVIGAALKSPPSNPSASQVLGLDKMLIWSYGDLRNHRWFESVVERHQPEVVIHMAAQPIVLESYKDPYSTLATNVMGTASVLEAVRKSSCVKACIVVTSDKCYAESSSPRREVDRLGGHDPYSMSKAAAELVTASYTKSFFTGGDVGVASVRAGNVIGGGDWGLGRIVPDAMRAWNSSQTLAVRHPTFIRPWQHVLEPLSGYLWLTSLLLTEPRAYSEAWNFGPEPGDVISVRDLLTLLADNWGGGSWSSEEDRQEHESSYLQLDTTKVLTRLHWSPAWDTRRAVAETVAWYRQYYQGAAPCDLYNFTLSQIATFAADARARRISWACER